MRLANFAKRVVAMFPLHPREISILPNKTRDPLVDARLKSSESVSFFSARQLMQLDPYSRIALFDAQQNQAQIKIRAEQDRINKAQYRKELDQQIHTKKTLQLKNQEKDKIWMQHQTQRIAEWKRLEQQHIEKEKEKAGKIKQIRSRQVAEHMAIQKREIKALQQEEEAILLNIHRELKKERVLELEAKQREAENMKKVIEQNELNKELRKEQKKKEAEELKRLDELMAQKYELEDVRRQERLAKTYSRQAITGKAQMSVQEAINLRAAEDERRANERILQDIQAAEDRVKREAQHREDLKQDMLSALKVQSAEKKKVADEELEYRRKLAQQMDQHVAKLAKEEEALKAKKKAASEQYRESILEQMKQQEERKTRKEYLMSPAEMQMNKTLFARSLEAANMVG